MRNYYDPEDTRQAAILFASVADKYRGNNNYEYDLVDICRQALADQGANSTGKPLQTINPSPVRSSTRMLTVS